MSPDDAAGRSGYGLIVPTRLRRSTSRLAPAWRLVRRAAARAWDDRVLGLSAEAAFWALLSLPPLLLAVLGTVGYLGNALGPDLLTRIHRQIRSAAGEVLAPQAVEHVVEPVVGEVLSGGHGGLATVGFVLSLWAGSTAMSDYVNTITIAYGQRGLRSAVRSRLLAFALHLAGLVLAVVVVPLLVVGPSWIVAAAPDGHVHSVAATVVAYGYWPTVILLCLVALAALYHFALPVRPPWRGTVPGAVVAIGIWLAGSYLLRLYLRLAFAHSVTYAGIGSTIAALLFLYVTALAILLGAELNAQLTPSHVPDERAE